MAETSRRRLRRRAGGFHCPVPGGTPRDRRRGGHGSRSSRHFHHSVPVRAAVGVSGSPPGENTVSLLRLWLVASAVALTALAVWAFAPVLVFIVLLTAALGAASALMIGLARA